MLKELKKLVEANAIVAPANAFLLFKTLWVKFSLGFSAGGKLFSNTIEN